MQLDNVTERYCNNWISAQWQTWQQAMVDISMPSSSLIRSQESKRRRVAWATGHGAAPEEIDAITLEVALPEWSAALPAVLWLLARWIVNMKDTQSEIANQLLESFLLRFITQGHVVWWISKGAHDDAWPADYTDADKYAVHIEGQMVDLTPMMQSNRMVSRAMHRSWVGTNVHIVSIGFMRNHMLRNMLHEKSYVT